jgi:hypothetical protein
VKLADDEITLIFSTIRLGKTIEKSNVMIIEEGCKMLWHEICLPTSPFGFNMRFGYFCM